MAAPNADESWPPKSARQALLSSPSGRKKYADFQAGKGSSPTKQQLGTPSLLDRLRLARNNQDHKIGRGSVDNDDEDEDDEETLQLKLAAIEAKLKLKKLQSKAKKEDSLPSRPMSVDESTVSRSNDALLQVEVPLSPTRRPQVTIEHKSPNRVRLGIDKGVTGADISLRRAKTVGGSPTKFPQRQLFKSGSRQNSQSSTVNQIQEKKSAAVEQIKSFSERMAESRDKDKERAQQHERVTQARSRGFQLEKGEIERFKAAAEESRSHAGLKPPAYGSRLHSKPGSDGTDMQQHAQESNRLLDFRETQKKDQGDAALFEGFSGLHLSTRILPHSFLKRTLPRDRYTTYRIPDLLKNVTSPAYEMPDEVCDFVVFGVIASKSNPFDQKSRADDNVKTSNDWQKKWEDGSQNRKKFMVFTLTDLKWTVDLYLFETALPRYHRLTTGTVVAILNPSIMPPKKGREDTGAFSLALHNGEDTVLEIGSSQHLGYCNAIKKDGKECGQWVNSTKTEICEWHLNAQITKTQSKRMGVNTGTNGFGRDGGQTGNNAFSSRNKNNRQQGEPRTSGRGFDWESSSHYYYVSSSNPGTRTAPKYNPDISTAKMLDFDDDPFVAEGQFSRDKGVLLAKRLATQEKERSIAKKLAELGDGSSAGSDYLRRKAEGDTSLRPTRNHRHDLERRTGKSDALSGNKSDTITNATQDLRAEVSRKRAAEDVRLSPAKKTRFLTDRGIKEAGKESLGSGHHLGKIKPSNEDDDDDDDDLEII